MATQPWKRFVRYITMAITGRRRGVMYLRRAVACSSWSAGDCRDINCIIDADRVYVTVERQSVCLSVPLTDNSSGVRRVCCWTHCGQKISIDSCGRAAGAVQQAPALSSNGAAARRSAANAGNVTLTTDVHVGGWTENCSWRLQTTTCRCACSCGDATFCLQDLRLTGKACCVFTIHACVVLKGLCCFCSAKQI